MTSVGRNRSRWLRQMVVLAFAVCVHMPDVDVVHGWSWLASHRTWRAQATYECFTVLFMLSAFPFLPFFVLARVGMTGMPERAYNRHGMCVPLDLTGLSAFCEWLRVVLRRREVRRRLPLPRRRRRRRGVALHTPSVPSSFGVQVRRLLAEPERRRLASTAARLIEYTESHPYNSKAHAERKQV